MKTPSARFLFAGVGLIDHFLLWRGQMGLRRHRYRPDHRTA
jgi:hypothetical protein